MWHFSQAIEEELFGRLEKGESLRQICLSPHMPSADTIERKVRSDQAFAGRYARARELQAHYYADRIHEAAADCLTGQVDSKAASVAIGAWQWLAAKRAPKVYDRPSEVTVTGKVDLGIAEIIRQNREQREAREIENAKLLEEERTDKTTNGTVQR